MPVRPGPWHGTRRRHQVRRLPPGTCDPAAHAPPPDPGRRIGAGARCGPPVRPDRQTRPRHTVSVWRRRQPAAGPDPVAAISARGRDDPCKDDPGPSGFDGHLVGPGTAPWHRGLDVADFPPRLNRALCRTGLVPCKKRIVPTKAPPWPGDKRLGAPGRVRPPPWEDALAPTQGAGRQGILSHKPRGSTVAGLPPRSGAALWCAGLKAGKTRAFPNRAPPWPGIKRVSAPGRVRPPAREDALAPYQDAGRRGILHHKPRGTIVAGVPPRSDAALWCTGLIACKTREVLTKAPPGPIRA